MKHGYFTMLNVALVSTVQQSASDIYIYHPLLSEFPSHRVATER